MSADTSALKAGVARWAAAVHNDALDAMPDLMRPYAPLGKGETAGTLRRSIAHDRSADSGGGTTISGRIVAPVIQAETTDQGSPAHIIRPRRSGGLLFFYWPKIGRNIALPYVNHPGNAPKPWWQRALQASYGPSLRFAAIKRSLR